LIISSYNFQLDAAVKTNIEKYIAIKLFVFDIEFINFRQYLKDNKIKQIKIVLYKK
jgi:hypothetical protein